MEKFEENLTNESQFCNLCGNLKENCVCEKEEDEGLKDSKEKNKCPYCGAEIESDWKSCGMCGEVLVKTDRSSEAPKPPEQPEHLEPPVPLEPSISLDFLESQFMFGDIATQEDHLAAYLPIIEKAVEDGDKRAIQIIRGLLDSSSDTLIQTGVALVEKMIDTPECSRANIESGLLYHHISNRKEFWQEPMIQNLLISYFEKRGGLSEDGFRYLTTDDRERDDVLRVIDKDLAEKLFEVLKTTDSIEARSQNIALLLKSFPELIQEYMGEEMSKIGLNWDRLTSLWQSGDNTEVFEVYNNLSTIYKLEEQRPGSAAFLTKDFGIDFFGRYSPEMLVAQYDQREDDIPYGIIMYPKSYQDGTFYHDKEVFDQMFKSLKSEGVGTRVLEANGKVGLLKHLLRLDRKYGQKNKISFAIIGGHGAEDHIAFGPLPGPLDKNERRKEVLDKWYFQQKNSILRIYDLVGRGVSKTKSFFTEHPSIILSSCKTGTPEGVGQKISELLDAELMAPETPSGLTKITTSVDEKGVHLKAFFQRAIVGLFNKGKRNP